MMYFWFMLVGLVLGGLVASLWYQQTGRAIWFQLARVRALRRDRSVWQHPERVSVPLDHGGGIMPPPPTVVTCAGPPPGRPTS
jgi:hypothetical protein